LQTSGADTTVAVLLRLGALGLAWYLLLTTLAALGARLVHWPGLVRVIDLVTLPSIRRLIAGLTLSVAALSIPAGAGASPQTPPGEPPPVMRWIPAPPVEVPVSLAPVVTIPAAPSPVNDGIDNQPGWPTQWTVHHGDNFWSIASAVMRVALGRQPTDPEVARYWLPLVLHNEARLVSPDPSLIFPGQIFDLLPPPS
jgi:nucleoid-associated protein YgaU